MVTVSRIVCAAGAGLMMAGWSSGASPSPVEAAAAAQHESYFPSDAELRELLEHLVERGESKGLVLGLREPDGQRRVIVYGDAGTGASPLSSRTVYEIGSLTKTFIGAILADMVRRGEVSLDDPVAKFLPAGVKVPARNGRQITLLDLATHTSGLPTRPTGYQVPDFSNPFAHFKASDLYEFLNSYELQRDIGAQWEYSNLGFGLLGHALTRAAGVETLDALVRTRITAPLQMKMTAYGRAEGVGARMAKGHNSNGEVVPYWDFAELKGAGGLNSNAEDMLTYLDANVGEPRSPIETAMRDAHQPRYSMGIKGNSESLGWSHRVRPGKTIVYKGGSTAGFAGGLGFDPATRAGVVVLGNTPGFASRTYVVIQLLRGVKPVALPPAALAPYVGTYALGPDRRLAVTLDGGRLYGQLGQQEKTRLFAEAPDKFFLMTADVTLHFSRDGGGTVRAVTRTEIYKSETGIRLDAP